MMWIIKLFSISLKLYPRSFFARFATEMKEVFFTGLKEAYENRTVASFLFHELWFMPRSLASVYLWSVQSNQSTRMEAPGMSGSFGISNPGEGWKASILAGLPHFLMGILIVSSTLISTNEGVNETLLDYLLAMGLGGLFLGMLYSAYKGWKRWSASWMVYLFILVLIILSRAITEVFPSITTNHTRLDEAPFILIPLVLAYLLYKITCKDRLRGILASIAPIVLSWGIFLDPVPSIRRTIAWAWVFLLAITASVLASRTRRFSAALGLAILVPILGGLPFTYLGVSFSRTLPFYEHGPSLREVFRQYVIFLGAVLPVVLGPQLAVKIREIGGDYAKSGGKIFYRLMLGGMLLGLILMLIQWTDMSSSFRVNLLYMRILLGTAAGLYIVGFAFLLWSTLRAGSGEIRLRNVSKLVALSITLLCMPIVMLPAITALNGNHTNSLWHPIGVIIWAMAAFWVAKD